VRDIGKAVGLASSSTVHAHLANLEKLGLLRRDPSKPRAIELLDRVRGTWAARRQAWRTRSARCARAAARRPGRRRLADPGRGEHRGLRPGAAIAGGEDGEYVLRVRGESMKDAGILGGDFVVVRPQDTASDGEIIVALVGEEATVKRFFRESDHVRLQPENAAMEPIRSKEVRILGRVVGVFRSVT
jgi:repressor LexA